MAVRVEIHARAVEAILSRAAERTLMARGRRVEGEAKRRVRVDEGRLRNSIHTTFVPGPRPKVTVGSNVKYARWVHDGTGIHGPTGRMIVPVRATVLRWPVRGMSSPTSRSLTATGVVYARRSRGSTPNPYLRDALRAVR